MRTRLYFFSFFFFTSQWRKNPESPKRDSCNPMPDNELNLSNQEEKVVTHRWWLFFVPKKINHKPNRKHTHTEDQQNKSKAHRHSFFKAWWASSTPDQVANSSPSETKCCWTTHILLSHSHANAGWPPHKLFEIPSEGAPFLSID